MTRRTGSLLRRLRAKGPSYWIEATLLGLAGIWIGHWLESDGPVVLRDAKYRVYQSLSRLDPRPKSMGDVVVVLVGDDEYWKSSELAGRSPINRRYVARLVRSACAARPKVLAIDFDLRSPVTDGSLKDHAAYASETAELAKVLSEVSPECRIVLPATYQCAGRPRCVRDASVLDGLLPRTARISWGYINFPRDMRLVPLNTERIDDGRVDSFAQAIARAGNPDRLRFVEAESAFVFGDFIPPESLEKGRQVIPASALVGDASTKVREALEHRVVIIGGAWRSVAYGRGPLVDTHASPVGPIPGVYVHANHAAAIMDGRVREAAPRSLGLVVEIALVLVIACAFALLPKSPLRRWGVFALAVAGVAALAYLAWQNFGMVFDPLIAVVLLAAHSLFDEFRHMRSELAELRAKVSKLEGEE